MDSFTKRLRPFTIPILSFLLINLAESSDLRETSVHNDNGIQPSRSTLFSNTISTSFEDNSSSSFGNMWDVLAVGIYDVTVIGLDFHTIRNDSHVFYEVYTNDEGYRGFESDIQKWKLVGSGSVLGQGKGSPTPINRTTFLPVTVRAGSRKGFYLTLMSHELIHSPAAKEGTLFVSDNFIGITVGTGVVEPKFGQTFFRPSLWNGNIHYTVNYTAQPVDHIIDVSSVPDEVFTPIETTTALPTIVQHPNSTLKSPRTCTMSYPVLIGFPPKAVNEVEFQSNIRSQISNILEVRLLKIKNLVYRLHGDTNTFDHISKDPHIIASYYDAAKMGRAFVGKVRSLLSSAIASDDIYVCEAWGTKMCMSLQIIVSVQYEGAIEENDVRYKFLHFSSDVMNVINDYSALVQSKYYGALPFETNTIFTMVGVGPITIKTHKDRNYLQNAVKSFLNVAFAQTSLEVYGVRLVTNRYVQEGSRRLRNNHSPEVNPERRYDHSRQHANIEVTLIITGEYTPSPTIDVTAFIDDSILHKGSLLVEDLKKKEIFHRLVDVKAVSTSTSSVVIPTTSSIVTDDKNEQEFEIKVLLLKLFKVAFVITMVALTTTMIAFRCNACVSKNKTLPTRDEESIERSEKAKDEAEPEKTDEESIVRSAKVIAQAGPETTDDSKPVCAHHQTKTVETRERKQLFGGMGTSIVNKFAEVLEEGEKSHGIRNTNSTRNQTKNSPLDRAKKLRADEESNKQCEKPKGKARPKIINASSDPTLASHHQNEIVETRERKGLFSDVGRSIQYIFMEEVYVEEEDENHAIEGATSTIHLAKDALVERGEKIMDLGEQTDKLANQSKRFAELAKALRAK